MIVLLASALTHSSPAASLVLIHYPLDRAIFGKYSSRVTRRLYIDQNRQIWFKEQP